MATITLQVKPYLVKYMYVHYNQSLLAGAIRLPSHEILYHALEQLTTKRPKGVSWKDKGNLTLTLPHTPYGKSPKVYNYLSKENASLLEKR